MDKLYGDDDGISRGVHYLREGKPMSYLDLEVEGTYLKHKELGWLEPPPVEILGFSRGAAEDDEEE